MAGEGRLAIHGEMICLNYSSSLYKTLTVLFVIFSFIPGSAANVSKMVRCYVRYRPPKTWGKTTTGILRASLLYVAFRTYK